MRTLCLTLACLALLAAVNAQDYPFDASLYDAEQIKVTLDVHSDITLVGAGSGEKLTATMYYVPEEAMDLEPLPATDANSPLIFVWHGVEAGTYPFGYSANVLTHVQKPIIAGSIAYPFETPAEYTQYLQPQEITDTNKQIRRQAQSLAQGTDDAMAVVFSIATWVGSHVSYNLTSVTSQASKQSSWVFQNRYGVCDELTSLFISMSREAGIPARFVSGIAYTNLQGFADHWGPHGWAEVWLPDIGWVPVDVTYGQIGYVDATHIPIRHGLDAKNDAVDFSLFARGLAMQPGELETSTYVVSKRGDANEPLRVRLEPLYDLVGSESGNLLTARITNDASYYVATDAYLAITADTTLHDPQRQQVLLPPGATREITWRATTPKFRPGYDYTVPFTVLIQRGPNATVGVSGSTQERVYPVPPAAGSGNSVVIDCTEAPILYTGENGSVTCTSEGATVCQASSCAQGSLTIPYTAEKPGAFPMSVTAKKGSLSGSVVVTFIVEEQPRPSITATLPPSASLVDNPVLTFTVNTAALRSVTITAGGRHFSQEWTADQLQEQAFELRFPASVLDPGANTITITVDGVDRRGDAVHGEASVPIALEASAWERVQLWLLHLFS